MKLRPKHIDILFLLYRFRFLTRYHIQTLLLHKNHQRILEWLNNLSDAGYILRSGSSDSFEGRNNPKVYCLTSKSRKVLKATGKCNLKLLNTIYSEKKRSERFKAHCLFLADLYLKAELIPNLKVFTKVDIEKYEFFPTPRPDLYIAIQEPTKTRRYFLELIDEDTPRKALRAKVQRFFAYAEEGSWQEHSDQSLPYILFICPDEKSKKYLNRFIQQTLEESYEELSFFLTTKEAITKHGLKSITWEKVKKE